MFIFHIGFPKTGTTSLQTFLKNQNNIQYLGKFTDPKFKAKDKIAKIITYLLYSKDINKFYKTVKKYKLKLNKQKIYFYSEEDILNFYCKIPLDEKIKRLKYFLSFNQIKEYKILIGIRKPVDLIMSLITEEVSAFRYKKKINYESLIHDERIIKFIKFKKKIFKFFPKKNLVFFDYESIYLEKNYNKIKKLFKLTNVNLPTKNISKKIQFEDYKIFISKIHIKVHLKNLYYSKNFVKFFKNLIFTFKNFAIVLTNNEYKKLEKKYNNL